MAYKLLGSENQYAEQIVVYCISEPIRPPSSIKKSVLPQRILSYRYSWEMVTIDLMTQSPHISSYDI